MPFIMGDYTVTSPPLSYVLLILVGSSAMFERPHATPRLPDLYDFLPLNTVVCSSPLKAVPASRELYFHALESQHLGC